MLAEGEFALIHEHLEAALRIPSDTGDHDLYAMLVDAAVLENDLPALERLVPEAMESADHAGHRLYQAVAHRARGVAHRLAGRPAEAQGELVQALEYFSELGAPWQIGRTHYELGRLAQDLGDTELAAERYKQALAILEPQGAEPDVRRVREALGTMNGGALR